MKGRVQDMSSAVSVLQCVTLGFVSAGLPGEMFASIDKALDERTIGHNPERLCLLKVHMMIIICLLP